MMHVSILSRYFSIGSLGNNFFSNLLWQNLVKISLKNCSKVTAKAIKCLAEAFTALQYLDLTNCHTACKDDVLACIGNNCFKLKQLILDGCSMLTDLGIQIFCQSYVKANRDRKLLRKISLVNAQVCL